MLEVVPEYQDMIEISLEQYYIALQVDIVLQSFQYPKLITLMDLLHINVLGKKKKQCHFTIKESNVLQGSKYYYYKHIIGVKLRNMIENSTTIILIQWRQPTKYRKKYSIPENFSKNLQP